MEEVKSKELTFNQNPLMPLSIFLKGIKNDGRIRAMHMMVFITLYELWLKQKGANPIPIKRQELMEQAKISSKVTWHKTIKELDEFGYIIYKPLYHKKKCSEVCLLEKGS